MSRRYLCVCLLAATVAVVSPSAGRTQNFRGVARWTDGSVSVSCAPGAGERSEGKRRLLLHPIAGQYFAEDCRALNEASSRRTASEAPPTFVSNSVESELRDMAAAGQTITAVREEVLEILREGNACSAWYAQAERDPAVKFASLHFRLDGAGEAKVLPGNAGATIYYREPYVARAQQDVGAGSMVTLNAHGAFFQFVAVIDWQAAEFRSIHRPLARRLTVGDYPGGSLKAQVTTLLHEYALSLTLFPWMQVIQRFLPKIRRRYCDIATRR